MAKGMLGPILADVRGKVGAVTFSRPGGQLRISSSRKPAAPPSVSQINARTRMTTTKEIWDAEAATIGDSWFQWSITHSVRDRTGTEHVRSPYLWFSWWRKFAEAGDYLGLSPQYTAPENGLVSPSPGPLTLTFSASGAYDIHDGNYLWPAGYHFIHVSLGIGQAAAWTSRRKFISLGFLRYNVPTINWQSRCASLGIYLREGQAVTVRATSVVLQGPTMAPSGIVEEQTTVLP